MNVTVGIDMGGTRVKIGFIHNGEVLFGKVIPSKADGSLSSQLNTIADEVNLVLEEKQYTIDGVGIAFPGIVNASEKKILSKYVKYPDATSMNLADWAKEKWGVPFVLENDVRAALLGEWQFGAGHGANDLVMITLGTGVGSAVMFDGKLLRGVNHIAGNLGGHMTINLNGDRCNCGHIGCVESESSTWMLKKVQESDKFASSALSKVPKVDFASVFACAKEGDDLALEIREHSLNTWALGIINMVLAYDPERIVIGGGIMHSKQFIIPRLIELIKNNVWIKDNPLEIKSAEQLEYAGILGLYHLLNSNL